MRAIFFKNKISKGDLLDLDGPTAKHLISATRVRLGEEVLILNNSGSKYKSTITSIDKKSLKLKVGTPLKGKRSNVPDIILMLPKKEAFIDILKSIVELGVHNLYPFSSEYSQQKLEISGERLERVLESSIIQSNNPFGVKIRKMRPFSEISQLTKEYDQTVYFSSIEKSTLKNRGEANLSRTLIIIGAEGGLSSSEEKYLKEILVDFVNLPTYILRSKTAVSTAVGFLCGLKS